MLGLTFSVVFLFLWDLWFGYPHVVRFARKRFTVHDDKKIRPETRSFQCVRRPYSTALESARDFGVQIYLQVTHVPYQQGSQGGGW